MFSYSKVSCFERCPLAYKLAYIDNVKQTVTSALIRGSKTHKVFENLESIEDYSGTEGYEIAKKFLETEVGKSHLNEIKSALKEHKFGIKKENNVLVPCNYNDKDVLFHGIIDLLNGNHILDYKTGSAKSFKNQDWSQLTWYAIWLFLNSDFEEIKITYMYVEHNVENSKILKRSELPMYMFDMLSRIKAVKDFENNPTDEFKKSWLCSWCTCKEHCSHYSDPEKLTNFEVKF